MMTGEQKAAWLSERCGCLTASRMADALCILRNGAAGAQRTRYIYELIAERVTGFSAPHVVTPAMERGLEYEDEMFDKFVELTGRDVKLSHLYAHPEIPNFKATPDREIDDGLMEGKIPAIDKFIRWKLEGVVPEEHKPQMLAQMACTRKRWVGFVAYCPEIKEERHRLFLAKFAPDWSEVEKVEDGARKFLAEVDAMFEAFTTQAA